jgi:hypothetical protein
MFDSGRLFPHNAAEMLRAARVRRHRVLPAALGVPIDMIVGRRQPSSEHSYSLPATRALAQDRIGRTSTVDQRGSDVFVIRSSGVMDSFSTQRRSERDLQTANEDLDLTHGTAWCDSRFMPAFDCLGDPVRRRILGMRANSGSVAGGVGVLVEHAFVQSGAPRSTCGCCAATTAPPSESSVPVD